MSDNWSYIGRTTKPEKRWHVVGTVVCVAALGMGLFTQWYRADGAERRAAGWEEIARKEGAAIDDLMAVDKRLKAATDQLQIACTTR